MVNWYKDTELDTKQLKSLVEGLLVQVGLPANFVLHSIDGGANNRIFRLESKHLSLLLKVYFQHPNDCRNRLQAEFSFARFAWENGIRSLPKPIVCDYESHLALYEFVSGKSLQSDEVKHIMIEQVLQFYHEINRYRGQPKAQSLSKASEACFSIAEHLSCVEKRIQDLKHISKSSPIDQEAFIFIQNELSKVWSNISDFVQRRCSQIGLPLENEIKEQDRRLSPSDFGFHNVILRDRDKLCFIDFEYAGWDDPAKMVCDFLCQPAVPVPSQYHAMFVNSIVSDLTKPDLHLERIAMLLPVYRIKWCCIMLNDFAFVGSARRRFAKDLKDQEKEKEKQLEKARRALNNLNLKQDLKV